MLFILLASILTCIFTLFLRLSLWRKKCSQRMPGKKPGLFNILGDVKELIVYHAWTEILSWQKNALEKVKMRTVEFGKQKLFCMWMTYVPAVIVVKHEAVKELVEKKVHNKPFTYKWLQPLLGTGLLTSQVSKWKPRRKLLMPCFNLSLLRGFLPVFNGYSQRLVELFQEETKKEFTYVETPVTRLTLDIICETMFGVKIGALENENSHFITSFRRILEIFMLRLYKIWIWPNWAFNLSKEGKENMHHVQVVHNFTRKIIHEKKENYLRDQNEDKVKRKALLDRLLEIHMETGELSEEDIKEEVNTFTLAGYETISVTIIWALFLIGLYSDVQAKIHEELDKVFGEDRKRYVTEKDLNDLQYLDRVLKESLRLYPSAPMVGRKIREDINICGHTLPKEATILVLTYLLHRDEEVFPDPEKFDPERFLPPNSLNIPEYAYIPFSAGPRNCIGKTFAEMELKVILSSILRNFTLESLDSRDQVEPLFLVTLHPSQPVRIRIRKRINQKSD